MTNPRTKGILIALIAAFISGVSVLINKFAVDTIKQPLVFTTVKNTGVALLVLTLLLASGKLKKIKNLSKKEFVFLGLIGLVGGSIPFYFFFTGLSMIPAVNGQIIYKTLVLWVAVLALPLLGEKLSFKGWLAVVTLFAANVLVGGFKGFGYSLGELYVLIATVFWAIETILAKKILPTVDPDLLVEARMGIGAIILLSLSAILQPKALMSVLTLGVDKWFWIILTIIPLLTYLLIWYRGLRVAPATTMTAILVASTLITNILSAIFVTHTLNLILVVQSLAITLGVFVIYRVESKAPTSMLNTQ